MSVHGVNLTCSPIWNNSRGLRGAGIIHHLPIFSPTQNTWREGKPLPFPLECATSSEVNDTLFVSAGFSAHQGLSTGVHVYDVLVTRDQT